MESLLDEIFPIEFNGVGRQIVSINVQSHYEKLPTLKISGVGEYFSSSP